MLLVPVLCTHYGFSPYTLFWSFLIHVLLEVWDFSHGQMIAIKLYYFQNLMLQIFYQICNFYINLLFSNITHIKQKQKKKTKIWKIEKHIITKNYPAREYRLNLQFYTYTVKLIAIFNQVDLTDIIWS